MSSWDEMASGWDQDPAVMTYAEAAWESLQKQVEVHKSMRVLDFGCGTGLLTEHIAPHVKEVVAVDAAPKMVEVLKAKNLDHVMTGVRTWTPGHTNLADDPLTQQPFDLIVCSSVCAFLENYSRSVNMLSDLLNSGGYFVQWDWELNPSDKEPYGLTRAEITQALSDSGLMNISVDTGFDVPFEAHRMRPLMGIGRKP